MERECRIVKNAGREEVNREFKNLAERKIHGKCVVHI